MTRKNCVNIQMGLPSCPLPPTTIKPPTFPPQSTIPPVRHQNVRPLTALLAIASVVLFLGLVLTLAPDTPAGLPNGTSAAAGEAAP